VCQRHKAACVRDDAAGDVNISLLRLLQLASDDATAGPLTL